MPKVDYKNTFDYFEEINSSPVRESVLDYGCNYGTFLDSSKGRLKQEEYTGIDIDKSALEDGEKMFPNATFIHYDRFNVCYNHTGRKNIWPDIKDKFKFIVSYSVLTHTDKDDMLDTIEWLYSCLINKGKMFITYISKNNSRAKHFFYSKRVNEYNYCDIIDIEDYAYLIDNKITTEKKLGKYFVSFYDELYLKKLLSDYDITFHRNREIKFLNCFQDCFVIEKSK
jgi:SAM-dependent methyltransferase